MGQVTSGSGINLGGTVGTAVPIAPPEWKNYKTFTKAGTYSGEVVPQNVYQMLVAVWGAGGAGKSGANNDAGGGGGGGFAMGIHYRPEI